MMGRKFVREKSWKLREAKNLRRSFYYSFVHAEQNAFAERRKGFFAWIVQVHDAAVSESSIKFPSIDNIFSKDPLRKSRHWRMDESRCIFLSPHLKSDNEAKKDRLFPRVKTCSRDVTTARHNQPTETPSISLVRKRNFWKPQPRRNSQTTELDGYWIFRSCSDWFYSFPSTDKSNLPVQISPTSCGTPVSAT